MLNMFRYHRAVSLYDIVTKSWLLEYQTSSEKTYEKKPNKKPCSGSVSISGRGSSRSTSLYTRLFLLENTLLSFPLKSSLLITRSVLTEPTVSASLKFYWNTHGSPTVHSSDLLSDTISCLCWEQPSADSRSGGELLHRPPIPLQKSDICWSH